VPGARLPAGTTAGGGGGGSGAAAGSSAAAGSPATPSGGSGSRLAAKRAAASPQARRQAQARHQAREQRLRTEVQSLRGCLGSLNSLQRRFLSLRAGLDGPPLSRAAAARRLGISRARAGGVERRGLSALHSACGGPAGVAMTTQSMPGLQPAALLVATGGPAPQLLVDQQQLAGEQQVKGEHATSPKPGQVPSESEGGSSVITSHPMAAAETGGGFGGAWVAVAAALALMTTLAVVGARSAFRRPNPYMQYRGGDEFTTAATAAPAAPPRPAPEAPADSAAPEAPARPDWDWPAAPTEPAQDATAQRHFPATPVDPAEGPAGKPRRDYSRAAMVASGLVSLAAREIMRRRRGGRRKR
jgi:hypothetical protein